MTKPYEPTPLEIWRQCSDIQSTWTRDEELRRRGAGEDRWRPPGCDSVLRQSTTSRFKVQRGIGRGSI